MKSKTEIRKPNIYIAKNMIGSDVNNSALTLAEAIEHNPFISTIFAVEALYDMYALHYVPPEVHIQLQSMCRTELDMADIVLADMRDGDPVELGYAIATGKPIVAYNPTGRELNQLLYGQFILEITSLNDLEDCNFLNILLQQDK